MSESAFKGGWQKVTLGVAESALQHSYYIIRGAALLKARRKTKKR